MEKVERMLERGPQTKDREEMVGSVENAWRQVLPRLRLAHQGLIELVDTKGGEYRSMRDEVRMTRRVLKTMETSMKSWARLMQRIREWQEGEEV